MPPDAPGELAALRQLIAHLLPTSAQLGAFCGRHFPSSAEPGGATVSATTLVDRLLARASVAEVRYRLSLEQPAAVAQHTDYSLQVPRPPGSPRPLRHLPQPRDAAFSGRAEELGRLRGLLERHRAVVISGPAGVGKTALAGEFGHRAGAEYAVVYWLDVATPESLATELRAFAQRLQEHGWLAVPSVPTVEPSFAAVRDLLSRRADWLVVVDGARQLGEGEALLGSGRPAGHLIYTTDGEVAAGPAVLELGPLTDAEALQLLARRSDRHRLLPGERLAVQRLAAALGYFPAALSSVADAVRQSGLTWIEALAQLAATAAARKAG